MRMPSLTFWIAITFATLLVTPHTTVWCQEVYTITQPNVQQPITEYPNIRFLPGDRVTVNADGCVQTGGSGLTWKHYVHPRGEAADRRYHGLVFIPGATPGLVRIGGVINRPLDVPVAGPTGHLILGYEDDNYSDNGYWGHDDGNEDQCKNVSPAWVTVVVRHGVNAVQGTGNKTGGLSFDLSWQSTDPNSFPWMPLWWLNTSPQWASTFPSPADCNGFAWTPTGVNVGTRCVSFELASDTPGSPTTSFACNSSNPINGHVNWGVVTTQGHVHFTSIDPGITLDIFDEGDNDVNISLGPFDLQHAPLLHDNLQNGTHIGLEFNKNETLAQFTSDWWQDFPNHPHKIDDKDAVVVGLFEIDTVHGYATELHPVYAMAIHIVDEVDTDEYAFFVRNWGNEGGCSQEDHPAPFLNGTFSFLLPRLPAKPGMNHVVDNHSTIASTRWPIGGTSVSVLKDAQDRAQAAIVSFPAVPDATIKASLDGVIRLKWSCDAQIASDPQNCGACGNICPSNAPYCQNGQCSCSLDLSSDPAHCGTCGSVCSGGTPLCVVGQCTCSHDLTRDPAHCGTCDIRCESGQCAGGVCQCSSDRPTLCNHTTCANLQTDRENCGACGQECTGTCQDGRCVCPASTPNRCTTGSISTCVDFRIDARNCGACGHSCNNFACENGVCSTTLCADGMKKCGQGRCIPEDQSCRSCGPCPRGTYCDNGECVRGLPQ